MNEAYPLVFEPVLLEKEFWGGRRLGDVLHKQLPKKGKIGESWEVSDYPGKETRVTNGPLAGRSLRQLVEDDVSDVVGDDALLQDGRFPLLVKYIDASETLSVQVHPDDEYARAHGEIAGKQEAWFIVRVEPQAKLIRGVTEGTDREGFERAIANGELDPCLHTFAPRAGDTVMIPWGTVHAIGKGIVLAEIEQTSDVTYRVYDWNRVDEQSQGRDLHVENALDVIRFEPPTRDTCERKLLAENGGRRFEAARCDQFVVEVLELDGSVDDAPPDGRFAILNVVGGGAVIDSPAGETALPLGSSSLVPACMPAYTIRSAGGPATVLRSYVPID
ncbi:MAG: type I phosphomannose isomerase catalytic subunit [Planctomycetota bacterium]